VFFGVPHSGSKDKLVLLDRVTQPTPDLGGALVSLSGNDESDFIDAMTGGSPLSDTLAELFRGINSHCPIVSFYENKPTGKLGIVSLVVATVWRELVMHMVRLTGGQVVDEASAKIGLAGEYIIRLEANHSDMCRFDTVKDKQDHESYLLVKKRVQTLFNNALPNPSGVHVQ